jgi:hypothetical protein
LPERICITRQRKASLPSPASAVARGAVTGPLFRGRLIVVDARFHGPSGTARVAPADLAMALAYLRRVAPLIAAYAGQYGPVALSADPAPLELAVDLAGTEYSDRELQGWIDGIATRAGLGADAALLVLNPPGMTNTDAKESGGIGVLGYHGLAQVPYGFVNALGRGFTLDDPADLYAAALSHEVAELAVDPRADGRNPEVCDGCGSNCLGAQAFRIYFDGADRYLGASQRFPPGFDYAYFLSAIARPAAATDCPAPRTGCAYPPP